MRRNWRAAIMVNLFGLAWLVRWYEERTGKRWRL